MAPFVFAALLIGDHGGGRCFDRRQCSVSRSLWLDWVVVVGCGFVVYGSSGLCELIVVCRM